MSEEIIKILDALADKFGIAIDWTSANIIPYLKELCGKYVNYEIATSVIWLLFGVACLIFGGILFKKIKYFYDKSDDLHQENGYAWGCIGAAVSFLIFTIVGIIVVMIQAFDIATCFTFPEKIIINELKQIYSNYH